MKKMILLAATILLMASASCNKKPENTAAPKSDTSQNVAPNLPPGLDMEKGKPYVIDFYADWCPPCRQMKPVFAEMEKKYGSEIKFVKADVDEFPDLAKSYGVEAIPTFVLVNSEGEEVSRITGACPASDLETALKGIRKAE